LAFQVNGQTTDVYHLLFSAKHKLEKASTHKSAKAHVGNVFVTHDLDP